MASVTKAGHCSGRSVSASILWLLVSAAMLLAGCGAGSPTGGDQGAAPGWLTVQLTSPNTDDGAVQLRISGPGIERVEPQPPFDGVGTASGTTGHLVLTGVIGSGNVARFRVSDVNRATSYSVSTVAAAQRGTFALRNTSGYRATVVR
ncbi:MAG: hypothetical protein KC544_01775 [Gemmatimonadetes bacterium]|nr:hypothetical protein [Gemmatimonadota bacterium]